jgi:hypothetical protein
MRAPGGSTTLGSTLRLTLATLALSGCLFGCDAIYEDLRPTTAPTRPPSDGGGADGGGALDGGAPVGGGDAAAVADGGATPEPLARGTWRGRTGYSASGTVTLERAPDGALHVRFEDDFDSQSVPGPVVVLSTRSELGSAIDPAAGDLELGVLESPRGPQRYAAPPEAVGALYAWIYCLPFGVEVARAPLAPVEEP